MRGVEQVNALGARWARELGGGPGEVWTALGVWPLLGMLAAGADPHVRAELEEALGVPAGEAAEVARELLAAVREVPGCGTALGLWTADALTVEPGWARSLGPAVLGRLSGDAGADQELLDRWADTGTGGLIRHMPVKVRPETLLVLASAVSVRTRWEQEFNPASLRPAAGPWEGRMLAGLTAEGPGMLRRLAVAETSAGPVTEVRVEGDGEVDVHLVLGGADVPSGSVTAAGFELVAGTAKRLPVAGLADGGPWPGLEVGRVESTRAEDRGALTTVAFKVGSTHDLLKRPGLFGLAAAAGRGGFGGICRDTPLVVGEAKQAAVAEFSAVGFEAGAVTAVAMLRGMAVRPSVLHRVLRAEVRLDRPFAFLAVHRPTGLVLMSGWVTDPEEKSL
ncbi:serpin family protein [Kitasatospora terrestris]|uniref:Serpin domain-containing protein n=1 Tax=Kitasatospora terrestris TaxID=258051 RepID=A0ABP9EU80_9ACTN